MFSFHFRMDVLQGGEEGRNRRYISGHRGKKRKMWGLAYNVYVWVAEESTAKDNQEAGKKKKKG